jgi:ATP-binding cassette subfamily F protein 3
MILVSAQDLGRQYSGDPIFSGLRFEIRAGERIGLVGTNGAGKSTLIRLIAGIDRPDYGHLHRRPGIRIGLLKQDPDFAADQTLMEVARSGLASLLDLQHELEEAAREMAEAEDAADLERATRRYQALSDQLEHQDAFSVEHRVEEILGGLGFATQDFTRPARTFSGGQQSRMMLAKLLLESPDLMLLDEPSNHLDIQTTQWLESYLSRQPVAMIVVSHDRYFLDAVVTRIWELHRGDVVVYPGNYTHYWRLREERAKVLERQAERQAEQIEDLKDFIARNGAGQKSKQAKDRERKLERIELVETMHDIVGPPMGFGEVDRTGDVVIEARRVGKGYDKTLFKDFSVAIARGQCVGVLGPNGAGKTTLLKILIGREKADAGEVKLGHRVQIGYYDQGLESLPETTPIVRAVRPDDDLEWVDQDTRDLLARFGLPGDKVFQTVGQLSGGERAKAALARLSATGANVLIMDEPTNHLDIWSCEALERSIREFEGTILVVSHDRYFLNQVADRIIAVADGRARVIEGDYETYQSLMQHEAESSTGSARPVASATASNRATTADLPLPPTAQSGKRRRRFPYRKPADIEREIGEKEVALASLQTALGDPDTYRDAARARDVQARFESTQADLARLYEHWDEALELNT